MKAINQILGESEGFRNPYGGDSVRPAVDVPPVRRVRDARGMTPRAGWTHRGARLTTSRITPGFGSPGAQLHVGGGMTRKPKKTEQPVATGFARTARMKRREVARRRVRGTGTHPDQTGADRGSPIKRAH